MKEQFDVIVIGAGIGGLTAAALLQQQGIRTLVLEKNGYPGGSCSSFRRQGFTFDAGASVFYGFGSDEASGTLNLHTRVFRRLGLDVPSVPDPVQIHYHLPAGFDVAATYDRQTFLDALARRFPHEREGIGRFYQELESVYDILSSLPAGSLEDPFHLLGVGAANPGKTVALAMKTFRSMGRTARRHISDPELLRFIDIESYSWAVQDAISTPLVNAGICLADRHHGGINYPLGGSGAIPEALVRGIEKFGGEVRMKRGVSRVLVEEGEARGVVLDDGSVLRAGAVVSNATIWDTCNRMVEESRHRVSEERFLRAPSWNQVWLGVEASAVPRGLNVHHVLIDDWSRFMEPGGTIYCSIPSLLDPSLAPPGCHGVHAFVTADTEPWEAVGRGGERYGSLKQEALQGILKALERIMPGISGAVKLQVLASPLTHERYLNRWKGSYGPLLKPGQNVLMKPQNRTGLKNLYLVGDSTFPGQGVIAVTYSGVSCASYVARRFGRPLEAL